MSWLTYRDAFPGEGPGVEGTIKVLRDVESPQLGNRRDVLVYVPPTHDAGSRRYPVVYFHDGQNLFDPETSFAGEWGADETLESLAAEGIEAIAVGIPNRGRERFDEYSPFVDARLGGGKAPAYVDFLADTVKPLVDAEFRTDARPEATIVAGSSMGGLVSLYAFFARPETFGGVAAMSPSVFVANDAPVRWLGERAYRPSRAYVDVGRLEGEPRRFGPLRLPGATRPYVVRVRRAVAALERLGWTRGKDLLYVEDLRGTHDEASWGRRLPAALRFLLG